jgi:cupin 2 domain-containing protein
VNIFDYISPQHGEMFTTLFEHKNVKINRIVSSDNLDPTEYLQEEDEWILLLQGKATLLVNNKEIHLTEGDTYFIPSKTPHNVVKTEQNTLWLTVHIH